MLLKADGVDKYARLIQQNIDQAEYLAGLIRKTPEFELTAPVPLNVVCFRYKGSETDVERLNELNKRLPPRLWFGSGSSSFGYYLEWDSYFEGLYSESS